MASIDFKAIHTAIKNKMHQAAFKYFTAASWFNFEMGVFPASSQNNGFTIKPGSGIKSEDYEADDWNESPWIIEFCLDGLADRYLSYIGKAYDAVKSLVSLNTVPNIALIEFQGWTLQNIDKHVILTYEVKVTINEIGA